MMDLGCFFAELKRHNVITESRNLGILSARGRTRPCASLICESWAQATSLCYTEHTG